MTSSDFKRVALIGLGLIGSSISHAMRRAGMASTIVGNANVTALASIVSKKLANPTAAITHHLRL